METNLHWKLGASPFRSTEPITFSIGTWRIYWPARLEQGYLVILSSYPLQDASFSKLSSDFTATVVISQRSNKILHTSCVGSVCVCMCVGCACVWGVCCACVWGVCTKYVTWCVCDLWYKHMWRSTPPGWKCIIIDTCEVLRWITNYFKCKVEWWLDLTNCIHSSSKRKHMLTQTLISFVILLPISHPQPAVRRQQLRGHC